ncbi:MAG: 2-oxo-4-hydroxy-4-carboxy-5-ureidoimidazoline decarboxylase [Proteobacteria bacterium]|nr:2-oxo-4-hydroxy-4-carboxy-5-ureidoimidazoline decarboxylase [Pseudomonadota bacterium]
MSDKTAFLKKYRGIYEHSPWIAEAAYAAQHHTLEETHTAMKNAVMNASHDKKLALIRAHPDLACAQKMTKDSVSEQKGAGLDQCTPEEFAEFKRLNAEYKQKFGFPFIIAVKGLTRTDILHAFRNRLGNSAAAEFETALEQIHKIAWFRLSAV